MPTLPVLLHFPLQLVFACTPVCYLLADARDSAVGGLSPAEEDSVPPVPALTALEGADSG